MSKLYHLSDFLTEFAYRAEEGDTVLSLSERFSTTPTRIILSNGLTEELKAGEIVKIEKIDGTPYIVRPSDTLESLSGYNEEKRREIMNKNKTDYIFVGQKIYI